MILTPFLWTIMTIPYYIYKTIFSYKKFSLRVFFSSTAKLFGERRYLFIFILLFFLLVFIVIILKATGERFSRNLPCDVSSNVGFIFIIVSFRFVFYRKGIIPGIRKILFVRKFITELSTRLLFPYIYIFSYFHIFY